MTRNDHTYLFQPQRTAPNRLRQNLQIVWKHRNQATETHYRHYELDISDGCEPTGEDCVREINEGGDGVEGEEVVAVEEVDGFGTSAVL